MLVAKIIFALLLGVRICEADIALKKSLFGPNFDLKRAMKLIKRLRSCSGCGNKALAERVVAAQEGETTAMATDGNATATNTAAMKIIKRLRSGSAGGDEPLAERVVAAQEGETTAKATDGNATATNTAASTEGTGDPGWFQ